MIIGKTLQKTRVSEGGLNVVFNSTFKAVLQVAKCVCVVHMEALNRKSEAVHHVQQPCRLLI